MKKPSATTRKPKDRKVVVTLYIEPEVLARLKALGDNWRDIVRDILRKEAGL